MVSVPDLHSANPQAWRDAAADALAAAKHCEEIGSFARDDVARTLEKQWVSDAGLAARRTFVKHAEDYEAANLALRELCRVYDDLADEIEAAQRDLTSALGYARDHELTVDDSGRVSSSEPASGPGDDSQSEPVRHAQGIIEGALSRATKADTTASAALRTIRGLTEISDPELVKEALKKNSPLAIALRLTGAPDGPHPINVSPSQLAAVERAAKETGMSKTLLLSILWQEQQWYQNYDKHSRRPREERAVRGRLGPPRGRHQGPWRELGQAPAASRGRQGVGGPERRGAPEGPGAVGGRHPQGALVHHRPDLRRRHARHRHRRARARYTVAGARAVPHPAVLG
ncbi:hypothetical protein [Streptomyces malaysiensis]|uniref:Uncharacterized protein n=1 Tax=Streptomyces malaysiensis TaxID=92644 RepID=A0A7X5X2B0_STRMQ|nr:hypothetical protein [Streptomyces malaysiensis]NIY65299.1 hypothetical protein [Streptomyces malaysiensis]